MTAPPGNTPQPSSVHPMKSQEATTNAAAKMHAATKSHASFLFISPHTRRTGRNLTRKCGQNGQRLDLKYSIVFAMPSASGTFGSQPRSAFASVMSGLRRFGSSEGSGR